MIVEDLFQTESAKLTSCMSSTVYSVTMTLHAGKLLPREAKDRILERGGTNYEKATRLMSEIQQYSTSYTDPGRYLIEVCHVLQVDLHDNERLKEIVSKILQAISESLSM